MEKNLTRLLLGLVSLVASIVAFYIGSLWIETRSAFNKLKREMIVDRNVYEPEAFIGNVLFEKNKTASMKPADFLARNALDPTEKHYMRYQLERQFLTRRLSFEFSEDQLLISWLSTVYLGEGEYGLALASKSLFNKEISELSKQNSIAIAALIVSPSVRNNTNRWEMKQAQLWKKLSTEIQ